MRLVECVGSLPVSIDEEHRKCVLMCIILLVLTLGLQRKSAFGSSDRMVRLVTVEPTQAREVLVISGHQGPVTQTRFHPSYKTLVRYHWQTRASEKEDCFWRLMDVFLCLVVFLEIKILYAPTSFAQQRPITRFACLIAGTLPNAMWEVLK